MNDNIPQPTQNVLSRFSEASGRISIVDILENIFFFRWYLLSVFLICFTLSIFYALASTPIYSANALIQVQDRKSSISALSEVNAMSSSPLVGEMEIIQSRSVISQAINNLKGNISISVDSRLPLLGNFLSGRLDKNAEGLVNPLWGDGTSYAWGGEELKLLRFSVPEKSEGTPFYLKVGADKAWTLSNEDNQILINGSGFLQENSALSGNLLISIESFKARPNTVFKIIAYRIEDRVAGIQGGLSLAESRRGSNIIRAVFESYSAEAAATTLNAITAAYLQQNIDRRSQEARRSLEFLDQELPRLKAKLDLAEKALNDFRNQKKTLDVPEEISNILTQATGIEKARAELILKRGELSLRFEPDHPTIRALENQLAGLSRQNDVINQQISALPQIQQDFFNKTRDVQVNSELYTSLLNNVQQLQVAKAGTTSNVDIVDPAIVPRAASRPNKVRIVAIGALLGLVLGLIACQLLAMLAGIVHDPKALEMRFGISIVGILPYSPEQTAVAATHPNQPVLLTSTAPSGQMSEAIRSLRTSVIFSLLAKPRSKVILITSAVPSQGKSFISANLAHSLSMLGKRVLLLEADVRRSTLKKYFSVDPQAAGLTGMLTQNTSLQQAIFHTGFESLYLLPAGPTIKNPGDYLASDAMREIIESAAESYDYVVIDSPPILPIHDSRVLAQYADMTLFIVRQELVSYTEVLEALKLLESNGTLVDGLVYNGFIPSPIRYGYGGYAYAYGYRGYRTGRYQYGYGGKRADYSSYYGSSTDAEISNPDNQSENIATLAEVVTPDPSTQLDEMRLLGRVFHRFSQLRTKLIGLILRKYRKGAGDDEDVA